MANSPEQKLDVREHQTAALVPELMTSDVQQSLDFWCNVIGFKVLFARPEENFYFLALAGGAQVMIDQRNGDWETGPMERPYGRGINLQITLRSFDEVLARLAERSWPIYDEREHWYRVGEHETGHRELLVQDPDGYLLRLAMHLGMRRTEHV
jgi:catechol 2,3-dioxygenase-like lactoylglutathione lyase family enzyme